MTPGSPALVRAVSVAGWTLCAAWLPAVLWLRSRRAPESPWAQGILRFLAIWAPVAATSWLVRVVCHLTGSSGAAQEVLTRFASSGAWTKGAIAVSAILLMPTVEEWVFRERLQSWFVRVLGVRRGVVLTVLVFAALHFSRTAFLPIAVLALGLSLARLHTGRLLPCIVMHALYNATVLSFLLLLGPEALFP